MSDDVMNRPVVIGSAAGGDAMSGMGAAAALIGASRTTGLGYTGYDGVVDVAAQGICDLRHEVGEVKAVVKDAESSIRHDVGDAECNVRHDILKSESDIRGDVVTNRFQIAQSGREIENRVTDLERNVDTQFCNTNGIVRSEGALGRETTLREAYQTREKMFEQFLRAGDKEETRFLKTWDGQQRLEDKLEAFERKTIEKFCHEREENLEEKVDDLRAQLQECRCCGTATPAAASSTEISNSIILQLRAAGLLK